MKTLRSFTQQGFSLIEMMIVVAIIGILSAIMVFAYETYVIRSIIAEGLVLAKGAQNAVVEAYSVGGSGICPDDVTECANGRIINYLGYGPPRVGSYQYEFTPTKNIKAIEIDALDITRTNWAGPDSGSIRIVYGGENKRLNELNIQLHLLPGTGGFDPEIGAPRYRLGQTTSGSIIWGCAMSGDSGIPFAVLARYVPARCRYKGTEGDP
jgi:prepilin-type N-terminal cleavage/methylation domain-containing protein